MTVDKFWNFYITDTGNGRIRQVDTNGIIRNYAGNDDYMAFYGDGWPAIYAATNWPFGAKMDDFGNLFIADTDNCRIRKVDTNGIISTVSVTRRTTIP